MLIVFCVILIILIAIGLTINEFVDTPVGSFLSFVFSVSLVICIIVGICMMDDIAEGKVIDEKIAVYEQENEKIIIHIKKCHENVIFNANKKQNSKKWLP